MTKDKKAYRSLSIESDEFYDLLDGIAEALKKNIHLSKPYDPVSGAYFLIGVYDAIRQDFWLGDEARRSLDELKLALKNLVKACERVPKPVLGDIGLNGEQVGKDKEKKFLKETRLNLIFASEIPTAKVELAADALTTLTTHYQDLLDSIKITRSELPQGIPSRNRPVKEWALIHATVELVRGYDAMNVPKDMESSGPLYKLLRDVFKVFGIEKHDFKGVYRGWKKHMDGKYENFDLMTI